MLHCSNEERRLGGGHIFRTMNIQGEHKRTLHFQSDTKNKCGVLRTSHLHQSIEKTLKVLFQMTGVIVVARLR
jgi:hypothetical protein